MPYLNPYKKTAPKQFFKDGTPWVAELLNNDECLDGTLLCPTTIGVEKKQKPFLHLSLTKAGPFTLDLY